MVLPPYSSNLVWSVQRCQWAASDSDSASEVSKETFESELICRGKFHKLENQTFYSGCGLPACPFWFGASQPAPASLLGGCPAFKRSAVQRLLHNHPAPSRLVRRRGDVHHSDCPIPSVEVPPPTPHIHTVMTWRDLWGSTS
jgi:hypothetical protein